MLTKQEREEITRRVKDELDRDYIDYTVFYRAITGKDVSIGKSLDYDNRTMFSIILDLCDTSDMMELPLDKDGKVIHIGDTVWYEGNDSPVFVNYIRFSRFTSKGSPHIQASVEIGLGEDPDYDYGVLWRSSNEITHAEPISDHERIAQEIEEIAAANKGTVTEEDLRLVAEEIRELGDDND